MLVSAAKYWLMLLVETGFCDLLAADGVGVLHHA